MCPINSQKEEKLAQYTVTHAHGRGGSQDEVKLAYHALRPLPRPRARWLTARGENFTTPSVYSSSLLRTLVSTPSIYLYKATIKKYILHLYKATNSNRAFLVYGSISKSLQPRQTVSGRINFVVCTVCSFFSRSYVYRGINQNECMNDH